MDQGFPQALSCGYNRTFRAKQTPQHPIPGILIPGLPTLPRPGDRGTREEMRLEEGRRQIG